MSKSFIVLGMHRSATSLVAKGLHETGVYMGDRLLPAGRTNPQGHFEDMDILDLNQLILKRAGGSWKKPPDPKMVASISTEIYPRQRQLLEEKATGHDLWGWKEPRTILTYAAYDPFIGQDPHLVCVFRKPMNVARSLQRRNNFSIQRGLTLTAEYNHRLIQIIEHFINES